MKTYKEVIRRAAEDALNMWAVRCGGFPEYSLIAWIYGVSEKEVYADFLKELEIVKQENSKGR